MSALNTAWMLSTLVLALQQTNAGSYIKVDPDLPEVKDLVARKYIKTNKKLHNADGTVGAVAVEGAFAEDLITDLGLDYATNIVTVPANLRKDDEPETVPVVETTPAAPQAPIAPAAEPAIQQAVEQAQQPQAPAFYGEQEQAPAAAPQGELKIGDGEYQVLNQVERRGKTIAIETGVAFVKKPTGFAKGTGRTNEEAYPYAELVAAKQANLDSAPSFHLADAKTKNVSSMIKRHALKYEVSHGITFRANAVDSTDPQGAGVRVYALTVAEAPARRATAKKDTPAE